MQHALVVANKLDASGDEHLLGSARSRNDVSIATISASDVDLET
jgi:hypothetical protein